MQNREIYDAALRFIAESTATGENNDYRDRAPYLIAAFCTEMKELDARIRATTGEAATSFSSVSLSLETIFPLSDRLFPAAILYLSAMLILDSDEERSDKLYAQYLEATQRISDAFPPLTEKHEEEDKKEDEEENPQEPTSPMLGTSHPIVDKYF